MIERRKAIMLIAFCVLVSLAIGAFFQGIMSKREFEKDRRDLDYYKKTYLTKNGWTSFYGDNKKGLSFLIKSFDGGKNWYVMDRGTEGELKVVGPAEIIYPGLIAHLEGWDRLSDYVTKNGPLTFGENAKKEIEILKGAGLEVKTK